MTALGKLDQGPVVDLWLVSDLHKACALSTNDCNVMLTQPLPRELEVGKMKVIIFLIDNWSLLLCAWLLVSIAAIGSASASCKSSTTSSTMTSVTSELSTYG